MPNMLNSDTIRNSHIHSLGAAEIAVRIATEALDLSLVDRQRDDVSRDTPILDMYLGDPSRVMRLWKTGRVRRDDSMPEPYTPSAMNERLAEFSQGDDIPGDASLFEAVLAMTRRGFSGYSKRIPFDERYMPKAFRGERERDNEVAARGGRSVWWMSAGTFNSAIFGGLAALDPAEARDMLNLAHTSPKRMSNIIWLLRNHVSALRSFVNAMVQVPVMSFHTKPGRSVLSSECDYSVDRWSTFDGMPCPSPARGSYLRSSPNSSGWTGWLEMLCSYYPAFYGLFMMDGLGRWSRDDYMFGVAVALVRASFALYLIDHHCERFNIPTLNGVYRNGRLVESPIIAAEQVGPMQYTVAVRDMSDCAGSHYGVIYPQNSGAACLCLIPDSMVGDDGDFAQCPVTNFYYEKSRGYNDQSAARRRMFHFPPDPYSESIADGRGQREYMEANGLTDIHRFSTQGASREGMRGTYFSITELGTRPGVAYPTWFPSMRADRQDACRIALAPAGAERPRSTTARCPSCNNSFDMIVDAEGRHTPFIASPEINGATIRYCPSCSGRVGWCHTHGYLGTDGQCPECRRIREAERVYEYDYTSMGLLTRATKEVIAEEDPSGRFLNMTMGIEFETGPICHRGWKKIAASTLSLPGWTVHVDPSLESSNQDGFTESGQPHRGVFRGWEVVTGILSGKAIEKAIDEFYLIGTKLPAGSFRVENALAGNHMHVGFGTFYDSMAKMKHKAERTGNKEDWDAYHLAWSEMIDWGKQTVRIVRQFVSKRRRTNGYCNGDLSYRSKHNWDKAANAIGVAMNKKTMSDSAYPRYSAVSFSGETVEFRIWPSSDNPDYVKARAELSQKLVHLFLTNPSEAGKILLERCPSKTFIQRGRLIQRLVETLGLSQETAKALDKLHRRYYANSYKRYAEWSDAQAAKAIAKRQPAASSEDDLAVPPSEIPREQPLHGTVSMFVREDVPISEELGEDLAGALSARLGDGFNRDNVTLGDTKVMVGRGVIADESRRGEGRHCEALVYLDEELNEVAVGTNTRIGN